MLLLVANKNYINNIYTSVITLLLWILVRVKIKGINCSLVKKEKIHTNSINVVIDTLLPKKENSK